MRYYKKVRYARFVPFYLLIWLSFGARQLTAHSFLSWNGVSHHIRQQRTAKPRSVGKHFPGAQLPSRLDMAKGILGQYQQALGSQSLLYEALLWIGAHAGDVHPVDSCTCPPALQQETC